MIRPQPDGRLRVSSPTAIVFPGLGEGHLDYMAGVIEQALAIR
jgi:hypothetical protein